MRVIRSRTITLPVLPGATVEWVKAQKAEMVKRITEDLDDGQLLRLRFQWTDKGRHRFMTVIADVLEVYEHAPTTA